MYYEKMQRGIFKSRSNRFLAEVETEGETVSCHVKNTGRLKELLIPGTGVWVQHCDRAERKTKYSLIAVEKFSETMGKVLVNIDSQAPNEAAAEWVKSGADGHFQEIAGLRREAKFGKSRFDLYFKGDGRPCFMEVKGVTLEAGGAAKFPDAPTERGIKHVEELVMALKAGYESYLLFVIQMKGIGSFSPNEDTHPAFGEALRAAKRAGVHILAYDCRVTEDSMAIDCPVEVRLHQESSV